MTFIADRAAVPFSHDLVGHPLLTTEAIADAVAKRPDVARSYPLQVPPGPSDALREVTDVPIADALRDPETHARVNIVLVLHQQPGFRELIREVAIDKLAEVEHEGVLRAAGTAFITSPGAMARCHLDFAHGWLYQIEGTKDLVIARFESPAVRQRELARVSASGDRSTQEEPFELARFRLAPGDGLYIPPDAFHWVEAVEGSSVAFACMMDTRAVRQARLAYACNHWLRRLGRRPTAPGGRLDRLKSRVASATGRVPDVV